MTPALGSWRADPARPVVYSDFVVAVYDVVVGGLDFSATGGQASKVLQLGGARLEEHVGFAFCATFNLAVTQLSQNGPDRRRRAKKSLRERTTKWRNSLTRKWTSTVAGRNDLG